MSKALDVFNCLNEALEQWYCVFKHSILQSQLEKENENLKGSKEGYESSLKQQESELSRLKVGAGLGTGIVLGQS